jgi:diguanylate cyclase (GGDEF)-like protein
MDSSAPAPDRATRFARLIPFALIAALGIVITPLPHTDGGQSALVGAVVGTVLAGGLLLMATDDPTDWRHVVGPLFYLASVGLLRESGGGQSSGVGTLVFLPVIWTGLYGTRAQLAAVALGMAAVFLIPSFTIGAPRYPRSAVRSVVLLVAMAGAISVTIQAMVERERRRQVGLESELERTAAMAHTDPLTGATNRRGWEDILTSEMARSLRAGDVLSIAIFDFDHFKEINDHFGHAAGDAVLKSAVAGWSSALRPADLLARIGGDEFAVMLPTCDGPRAHAVIERLRLSAVGTQGYSVGIATSRGNESIDDLMHRADRALYRAKGAGGDHTVLSHEDDEPAPPADAGTAESAGA